MQVEQVRGALQIQHPEDAFLELLVVPFPTEEFRRAEKVAFELWQVKGYVRHGEQDWDLGGP